MTPNLNAALAKAKGEFPQILADKKVKIPTKTGREINFTYAELEDIIAAVTPTLSSNGLCISSAMEFVEDKFCLITSLRHESGETIQSFFPLPIGFNDAKELGIQITYGRRYNTLCLLEISATEPSDRDEKVRSLAQEVRREAGLNKKPQSDNGSLLHAVSGMEYQKPIITEPQVKRLWAIARNQKLTDNDVKTVLSEFNLESTYVIPAELYDSVVERIQQFNSF